MKSSIIITSFFIVGIIVGFYFDVPDFLISKDIEKYILYSLLFFVGLGLGLDDQFREIIMSLRPKALLVPLSVMVGTYIGSTIFAIIISDVTLIDALAIGSGFGWYSLSSVLITEYAGEQLGVIALVANISREVLTLLLAPLMVKYFGLLSPIASGGATSMDTTLPMVTKFSGKEFIFISILNGLVLSLFVPIVISFLYSL
jgi:uncharacterized membrane protein YbjE (DUF340 family)